jgi:hypothetical protein
MLNNKHLKVSLEAIDYQKSNVFFKELTAAVAVLRENTSPNTSSVDDAGITRIVAHHTGLSLRSEYLTGIFGLDANASMMPPYMDPRSPLLAGIPAGLSAPKDWQQDVELKNIFHGTIDLKAGRVSGVFSDVMGLLTLSTGLLKLLSDSEVAAVILHECGHLFTYFESMVQTVTTAAAMQYVVQSLAATPDREIRAQLIRKMSAKLDIDIKDPAELAGQSDKVVCTVILKAYTENGRSGTGGDYYDLRTWEAMADQYASRNGAARDLATGLDKIWKAYGMAERRGGLGMTKFILLESMKVALVLVLGTMTIAGGAVGGPLATLYGSFLAVLIIGGRLASTGPKEGTYDKPGERLDRIKNDLVGALKDRRLSADEQERIRADIQLVEDIRAGISDRDTFFQFVWKNLTSYRRENYNQIEFQHELEKLANNDLFVASSRLQNFPR